MKEGFFVKQKMKNKIILLVLTIVTFLFSSPMTSAQDVQNSEFTCPNSNDNASLYVTLEPYFLTTDSDDVDLTARIVAQTETAKSCFSPDNEVIMYIDNSNLFFNYAGVGNTRRFKPSSEKNSNSFTVSFASLSPFYLQRTAQIVYRICLYDDKNQIPYDSSPPLQICSDPTDPKKIFEGEFSVVRPEEKQIQLANKGQTNYTITEFPRLVIRNAIKNQKYKFWWENDPGLFTPFNITADVNGDFYFTANGMTKDSPGTYSICVDYTSSPFPRPDVCRGKVEVVFENTYDITPTILPSPTLLPTNTPMPKPTLAPGVLTPTPSIMPTIHAKDICEQIGASCEKIPCDFATENQKKTCRDEKWLCDRFSPTKEKKCKDKQQKCQNNQQMCLNCFDKGEAWTALGCIKTDVGGFVRDLFRIILGVVGGIAFLLLLKGGYQIMMSRGNAEELAEGQQTITAAMAGLIFIFLAVFILKIIGVDIIGLPGFK